MSELKLTGWFPGSCKPVHIGVYERAWRTPGQGTAFSYWDGCEWRWSAGSAEQAQKFKYLAKSTSQKLAWRGVVKP